MENLLLPRNAKRSHTDQNILQGLLLCLKRNISQTFKSSSCKTFFPSVYVIDTACSDECFLFQVIIGIRYFLYRFIVTQSFFAIAMFLCSLKKSVFYVRYLHNKIKMLLIPKVHTKASIS